MVLKKTMLTFRKKDCPKGRSTIPSRSSKNITLRQIQLIHERVEEGLWKSCKKSCRLESIPIWQTSNSWSKVLRNLVGGFNPFEKICSSNWIISPSRGENQQYLKPPAINKFKQRWDVEKKHHLDDPASQKWGWPSRSGAVSIFFAL